MLERLYENTAIDHFAQNRQMLFLTGPRQVGKTTTSRRIGQKRPRFYYLNWDDQRAREIILHGPRHVAEHVGMDRLDPDIPLLVLDEIHKYGRWKVFLKGLFDSYPNQLHILATGSARLDVYKAGGDSLMGRYFTYRMHPLSIAELLSPAIPEGEISREPRLVEESQWKAFMRFGGFPEPFLRNEVRFFNRWRRLRTQQLLKEDLRDLTRVQELGQIETLALLLRQGVGYLTNYSALARQINVSVDSIRRWLDILTSLYYSFPVKPWFRNLSRALRKEPKYYLWDWSVIDDVGKRAENLVACALLKAVHFWTDHGLGEYRLCYMRDKEKREVDFIVIRNNEPWFLVEVKSSCKARLSKSLGYFQEKTGAKHAFQVAVDMPFVDADCFSHNRPLIVPARTFLSQLV